VIRHVGNKNAGRLSAVFVRYSGFALARAPE